MKPLSENYVVIRRTEHPETEYVYSPAIIRLESGRLVVTLDVCDAEGETYVSDDGGQTWRLTAKMHLCHSRLFLDGKRIYTFGHNPDIEMYYSDDEGESWCGPFYLTQGEDWHMAQTNVLYKNGYVYIGAEITLLSEEERKDWKNGWWTPNVLGLKVLRGKLGTDLTKRENWLFSDTIRYRDVAPSEDELNWFGIPFFKTGLKLDTSIGTDDVMRVRNGEKLEYFSQPIGWLETNLVEITDPCHYWHDPEGKTLHLFMRAHTAGSGYCCVAKAVERIVDGKEVINIELVTNPSGNTVLFLPMPGGQMKFFIIYDEVTKLYWLLSTQATDTMRRLECMPSDRYNIPCDERDRLTLHFSKNMVDWVFAGLVDKGETTVASRHYAVMDVDGDDLVIVSRSGDKYAHTPHHGNIATFHRVKNFRDLVY